MILNEFAEMIGTGPNNAKRILLKVKGTEWHEGRHYINQRGIDLLNRFVKIDVTIEDGKQRQRGMLI